MRNDMDTAMTITYQSSLQIALFVTPVLVLTTSPIQTGAVVPPIYIVLHVRATLGTASGASSITPAAATRRRKALRNHSGRSRRWHRRTGFRFRSGGDPCRDDAFISRRPHRRRLRYLRRHLSPAAQDRQSRRHHRLARKHDRSESGPGRHYPQNQTALDRTPGNPLLSITDIAACAEIANRHNILLGVDSTFATPVLTRPLELGAHIVMHSATKYIGGHSDLLGGALIARDKELFDRLYFIQNAAGAVMGPWESFLCSRGLKTLELRVREQCRTATATRRLAQHPSAHQTCSLSRPHRAIPATKSPRDK